MKITITELLEIVEKEIALPHQAITVMAKLLDPSDIDFEGNPEEGALRLIMVLATAGCEVSTIEHGSALAGYISEIAGIALAQRKSRATHEGSSEIN